MNAHRVTTTRTVGGVTLHLHQAVHVENADPVAVPWFPSDYVLVDLTVPLAELGPDVDKTGTETGLRLVALPLDSDSPTTEVTAGYMETLLEDGDAFVRFASDFPVWGY